MLPFQEERPLRNRFATFLVYAVPLAPYGWITYERAEAAKYFNTLKNWDLQMDEDFAKAAAQ